jgi:integrase
MPAPTPKWLTGFRAVVHSIAGRGWSVKESRGRIRLSVRYGAEGKGSTVTLPLEWGAHSVADALDLIRRLHHGTTIGNRSLRDALRLETSPDAAHVDSRGQWAQLVKSFHHDLKTHDRIKECTWTDTYGRFLAAAVAELEGSRPPANGYDLITRALAPWAAMPRSRSIAVNAICRWLDFGVDHCGLSDSWRVSASSRKRLKGRAVPGEQRQKTTLTDAEILQLIASIKSEPWANAIKLLALYGLRPEELNHLEARPDARKDVLRMWCGYSKTCGRGSTPPRWLFPVPLTGADGEPVMWNLAGAMAIGQLPLPPLSDKFAVGTFLRRQVVWQQLVSSYKERGLWVRPYSLRDAYATRAHQRIANTAAISTAMGHSLRVHSDSYISATEDTTAEAFDAIG